MMKIRWLSNGLYSLKNCHKQFGQAFQPPPPFLGNAQIYMVFFGFRNILQFLTNFSKFWQNLPTFGHFAIFDNFWQLLSSCCLSSCHPVILSYCLPYILSFCPFAILSVWQPVNFLACELVLHIGSMISFGGFLAECLPCCLTWMSALENQNIKLVDIF